MQEYKQKCQDEKRKLADVTNEAVSRKKQRDKSPERDDDTDVIETTAKSFTIMNLFWLHNHGKTFSTTVDEHHNSCERFDTVDNRIQGQIVEIHAALPARFLNDIHGSKWLKSTVSCLCPCIN